MDRPVRGWCLQNDLLLFEQTEGNTLCINILWCQEEDPARLMKLILPPDVMQARTFFKNKLQYSYSKRFKPDMDERVRDLVKERMLALGEIKIDEQKEDETTSTAAGV